MPKDIEGIAKRLGSARSDFLKRVEEAVGKTVVFAVDVSNAIGEISLDEAEDGIINFFAEEMRKG